jgi:hypothetical protein
LTKRPPRATSPLPGKAGLPKPIDLNAMHAYRDAIRSSDGDRPVAYAATLYPGATQFYDDGLTALRAYPTEAAALTTELEAVLRRALEPGARERSRAGCLRLLGSFASRGCRGRARELIAAA